MLGISNSVCNMMCSVSRPPILWVPCGTGLPAWDTPDGGRCSPRKQPTFRDTTAGFPAKWHLRNTHGNSMLMTPHYPDPGTASDWLKQIFHAVWPIRGTTQIWIVIRHQYGISALVSQTSFTYIHTYILYLSCRSVKKEAAKELMWTYKLKSIYKKKVTNNINKPMNYLQWVRKNKTIPSKINNSWLLP